MPPIFIAPMPTVRTQGGQAQAGPSQGAPQPPAARTSFRPPWIKDGPDPLPMPAAPWTLARVRDRRTSRDEAQPSEPQPPPGRKQSKITIVPSQPQENGVDPRDLKKDVVSAAEVKKQQTAAPQPSRPVEEAPQERKLSIQVESKQKPREEPKSRPQPREEPKSRPQTREEPKPMPMPMPPKEEVKLKPVAPKEQAAGERKLQIQVESRQKEEPKSQREPPKEKKPEAAMPPKPKETKPAVPAPRERRPPEPQPVPLQRSRTSSANLVPAPPPPPPPVPPPPPPDFKKSPLTEQQAAKIEALRSRPRKRPDWGAMMKEVEHGRKLKHVETNDRSKPLLPCVKVKEQFMYESEKPNVHNLLLKEIQSGVKLKKVQTNDRSRPVLEGLRKFRRQLTIEEQQQVEPAVVEEDELDDIDKLRDDLQSTKQMLALELRNKEAVEKENKRLQARILNLEVELEQERKQKAIQESDTKKSEEEKVAQKLREDLSAANKHSHELEQRCHEADLQLDLLRAELEEMRMRNATLERRASASTKVGQPILKQPSHKKLASSHDIATKINNQNAVPTNEEEEEEESEYEEETESEEEEDSSEDEEKAAALREKRNARELRLLATKVSSLKEKEEMARKERRALRMQLKNQQKALKEEMRKYKKLQKEVDKMAKLMKDDEEDEEDEDEDEEEEEEEEEEESEESSSEESEDDESDGELPPESPFEDRKRNFTDRSKRHENILAALKKGNYLLKANVEKVKDDLFKQKELSLSLQEDLNSVLAELG